MKICSKEIAAIVFGAGAPSGFGGGSSGGFAPSFASPAPPQSSTVSSGGFMSFLGNLTGFDSGVTNGVRDDGNPIGYGMGDAKTDHLVPDRLFGVDLSREGRQHDDKYSTIGYSKEAADAELGKDVSNSIGGILGALVGGAYQIGVALGGQAAYDNAQAAARRESSNAGGFNSDGGSSAGASAARGGMGFGGTGSGVGGDGGGDGGGGW